MEDWDIRELLVMIFRKKISIFIIVAIVIIAGCIYTYNYTTPMYSSNARIVLGKISTMDGEFLDRNITISETDLTLNSSLILTYSELAKSRSIMEEVKDRLQYNISADELLQSVTVSRINASDILQVSVNNKDPKIARDIVQEVVDVFSGHIKEIYKIDNVYIIDKPTVATEPFNIHHEKDIATFGLIGVFTACVYVILCIYIDNTVKNSNEIENLLKVRTLINIPIDKKKQGELITIQDGKSIISESFKTLRTNVQFSSVDSKGAEVLLVTSCMPSEGKSYVSANLAIAFAQTGKRVIIVDSDMRRGRQCKVFNVPNKNGLSNYISNIDSNGYEINWSLGEYIKKTHIKNLDIITAGSVPPNPSELLASTRLVELIDNLKKYYDVIIFDGAPILPITDSLLLGRIIGKVILVAVYNKTKKDNLVKAKESIEDVGGKVIGIVLNKVSMDSGSYGDGYYYYGEGEKGLTRKEKIEKAVNSKVDKLKTFFGNEFKKVRSFGKRLTPAKTAKEIAEAEKISQLRQKSLEEKRIQREIEKMQKDEEKKKLEAEKKKIEEAKAAEKARLEEIKAKERAKQQAIKEEQARKLAEERARQQAIREEEARIMAEEKAKREAELAKVREMERLKREAQAKKVAEEKAKQQAIREAQAKKVAEERAKQQAIRTEQAKKAAEERAKIEAIRAQERARFEAIRAQEKARQEEQRARERAEQEAIMREEARIMAEEKAKEDAIMAEEMLKMKQEEAKRRQEELIRRAEDRKKVAELKAKKKQERAEKFNDLRGRFLNKKDEISEELKIKKAEYSNRYSEYKIRKQEEKILAKEEKIRREAELAKIREEEKIKREEERKKAAEERAERLAKLEAEKKERLAKQAEEKAKKEAELARREAELVKLREAEKLKKEQEKRIAAEEKAKQIAILAEEKAKREAEAKLTDEYLQENLYPKTKYNKF